MYTYEKLPVALKLHLTLELPGGFIEMQIARPQPWFLIQPGGQEGQWEQEFALRVAR